MKVTRILKIVVMLIASPLFTNAQYFQRLFDNNSSQDWGWNILLKEDSTYFISGWSFDQSVDQGSTYNMTISNDGNSLLNHYKLLPADGIISIDFGNPGELKPITGGYIAPVTMQWPNPITRYAYSAVGIVKLNASGDTVFTKFFTDTALYFDNVFALGIIKNDGYLLGGSHGINTPNYGFAYLLRTDTMGNLMWAHTYQKFADQGAYINNVIPLADGRIVIGAVSTFTDNGGPPDYYTYYHNAPWFLLLDSTGSVIKDTMYTTAYVNGTIEICGELYADANGGYISIGRVDSFYKNDDPSDAGNLPGYVAHLDTNFRITWATPFPYSDEDGNREAVVVRQLRDSNYIVVGDSYKNTGHNKGFAAKISRTGAMLWSHEYYSDPTKDAYLRDIAEKPDGGLVMTGQAANDTLPAWHQMYDMWLIETDSNGCENALCAPTAVPVVPQAKVKNNEVLVYPNPTNSVLNFEFSLSDNVTIKLMDITGRVMDQQVIGNNATTATFNVKAYTAGMYLYEIITSGKTQSGKFLVE